MDMGFIFDYIWKYKINFFMVEDFWGMKEDMLVLIVKVLVIFWIIVDIVW